MQYSLKTLKIADKEILLETGYLAMQSTASVMGRMGDTVVVATVVMGKKNPNLDYFPLSVEYVERLYAGGRIKGSKWVKREGRPSDDAILKARLIDRSIRPLFPKEFKREVQVVITILSVDGQNDPDVLSIISTSAALAISKIPWNGPIGAVRIGIISADDGSKELVINPENSEIDFLDIDMVVSSKDDKVIMLEAGAKQVAEAQVLEAIKTAKEQNAKIIEFINSFVKEIGEKKIKVEKDNTLEEMILLIEKSYKDEIVTMIKNGIDHEVGEDLQKLAERISELQKEEIVDKSLVAKGIDYVFKSEIRKMILKDGKRPDGRKIDQVREISAKVSLLPRTHGSAVFQRGDTQVLTIATLGSPSLEQLIEGPEGEETKRYIHHYSMPPYSVGEVGRIGATSRREIGHGALAERALLPVIPSETVFPYVIRVVSEVMSSNGSTSMASTCGSTLSLMDAGVPILSPVAGVAIGLMTSSRRSEQAKSSPPTGGSSPRPEFGVKAGQAEYDKYVLLSDIIGLEDFSGDMDFKVAGTKDGITAIQLDVKIDGITDEQIAQTFERAKTGRLFILDKMLTVISESRKGVSQFAPKIKILQIEPEKIGDVIGSGGKVIRNIISSTGAEVDVDDKGVVTISSTSDEAVEKAESWIQILTRKIQQGEIFEGKVKRILPFGAMVEIVPGKEGLVHVSEMSTEYVKDPGDVVQIGQAVKVRVKEIDEMGRTNLSMLFGDQEKPARPRDDRPRDDRRPPGYRPGGRPRFDSRNRKRY